MTVLSSCYSEAAHLRRCGTLALPVDPILSLFLKLHVASDWETERQFRCQAAARLRETTLYKKVPQPAVEASLLTGALNPPAFFALCVLYGVNVNLVYGNGCYAKTGAEPSRVWVDPFKGTIRMMDGCMHLLLVNPYKPLYAVSHYTASELAQMCAKVKLPNDGTKAVMHAALLRTMALF